MKRLNELFDIDNDMKIYSIHSDSRYVGNVLTIDEVQLIYE